MTVVGSHENFRHKVRSVLTRQVITSFTVLQYMSGACFSQEHAKSICAFAIQSLDVAPIFKCLQEKCGYHLPLVHFMGLPKPLM
jgi:hypothetical protein